VARIRTIKPEFWSDEKLSECSLSARLTFVGLISFADDEGRHEFSPARLRMQIYPCGSVTSAQFMEYTRELTERSLIRVYTVEGKDYLDIPNFAKHQKINRPTPSRLPEYSRKAHGSLTEASLTEGNGREGNGRDPLRSSSGSTFSASPSEGRNSKSKTAKNGRAGRKHENPDGTYTDIAERRAAEAKSTAPDIRRLAAATTKRVT